jgi:hypothetical protein
MAAAAAASIKSTTKARKYWPRPCLYTHTRRRRTSVPECQASEPLSLARLQRFGTVTFRALFFIRHPTKAHTHCLQNKHPPTRISTLTCNHHKRPHPGGAREAAAVRRGRPWGTVSAPPLRPIGFQRRRRKREGAAAASKQAAVLASGPPVGKRTPGQVRPAQASLGGAVARLPCCLLRRRRIGRQQQQQQQSERPPWRA